MKSVAVVALDLHKRFSRGAVLSEEALVVEDFQLEHSDWWEYEQYLAGFKPGTDVVMEATFNWPAVADLVEKMGLCPHLAHPMRAREMAKGMPKSDRKDAIFLGRLWMAGGDIFPTAYLAPPEIRSMRDRFRWRVTLVRMATMLKNRIHGHLFKHGILVEGVSDLFSPKGRKVLAELRLPKEAENHLNQVLSVLDDLGEHRAKVEKEIWAHLKKDPDADLLQTAPGIGRLTAYAFLAEIGEIQRFPRGRALASYAGTLPMSNESADKDFGRYTNQRCNRYLRWSAIEAVAGAVRASRRMRSLYSRVRARNPKYPGKARIAVAREILEVAHLILTRQVKYEEEPSPRPGSEQGAINRRNKTRIASRRGETEDVIRSGQPGVAIRRPRRGAGR
jgi:transposase